MQAILFDARITKQDTHFAMPHAQRHIDFSMFGNNLKWAVIEPITDSHDIWVRGYTLHTEERTVLIMHNELSNKGIEPLILNNNGECYTVINNNMGNQVLARNEQGDIPCSIIE